VINTYKINNLIWDYVVPFILVFILGLLTPKVLDQLSTMFLQNSETKSENFEHRHIQRIDPKHKEHAHVRHRANINGKSTLHVDEGLETLEEVMIPQDLKNYVGTAVVGCDVIDSVYIKSFINFDDGSVVIVFSGNVKCTSDEGSLLVPADVSVTLDPESEVIDLGWQLTSPVIFNTI